jgi:putative transposase
MSTRCYDTDLNDAAWAWIAPYLPAARSGGRPRTTDLRAVLNAIFYLLRTGCQWRLLPREFPRPGTVYHYFRAWKDAGVLAELQRALHEQARLSRGCLPCPSVVILDSQSVKTAERGGIRGFDGHKRVKGRKIHLLVDTLGMVVARRVEAANVSDRRVGARLLAGLRSGFPSIRTVMADAARQIDASFLWRTAFAVDSFIETTSEAWKISIRASLKSRRLSSFPVATASPTSQSFSI